MKPLSKQVKEILTSFKPGSFGFHEMVDRSCLMAEIFSEQISQHPAAKHPALQERITKIETDLFDLYQAAATLPNEIEI
jgi:hypothetical protein